MSASIVVMAAGLGSRYGGIKQMEGMGPGGEILMEYSVYDALEAGFDDAVIILRPDIVDDFRDRFGRRMERRFQLRYALQTWGTLPGGFIPPVGRVKPYGTVHALLSAREQLNDNFAVINADDYYGKDAYVQMRNALDGLAPIGEMCMVAYELGRTLSEHGGVARGMCSSTGGYLAGIEELKELKMCPDGKIRNAGDAARSFAAQSLISMNIWGGTPWVMDLLETYLRRFLTVGQKDIMKDEYVLAQFIEEALLAGSLCVKMMSTAEKWYGVTYKDDRPLVMSVFKRMYEQGIYPSPLFP